MFDSVGQLEIFPRTLDLRRIDVARNMRRYYRLSVQRDLFGRACLIREWGRIGARGQSLIERHEEALLHKSGDGRASPFPGQTYPATSVTGVPSAVKPFRTATRTWNSAT